MPKLILLTLLVTLLLPKAVLANSTTIQMNDWGFSPDKIEIKQGEMVVFENVGQNDHWPASNIHPTHQLYPQFDPKKPIPAGQSWQFKFEKIGTWKFHDHLNPQFVGVVVVGNNQNSPSLSFKLNIWQTISDSIRNFFSKFKTNSQISQKVYPTPKPYNLASVYQSLDFKCSKEDFNCISDFLKKQTIIFGPQASSDILRQLRQDKRVSSSVDDHQLSHWIGRQTAQSFGFNASSFLLCPMADFNGGCQHGFFEYVLGKVDSAKQAAEKICESMGPKYSSKDKFYCYHGVGHGVMMAQAYDLNNSLETCNQLSNPSGVDGCWQGVFMENVNGGMQGKVRQGIFSNQDPLAPCNNLDKKYQHECFINHAGWLMRFFGNNFPKAANSCLNAPKDQISTCLQSIGLMVTNPSWQINFISDNSLSFEQKAWQLCQDFPSNYIDQCVVGAVDNLINFDQFNLTRVEKFCTQVEVTFTDKCFYQIGLDLSNQSTSKDQVRNACSSLKSGQGIQCLKGAGIS